MILSYWLRLVCLLLFSVGLVQTALALLLGLLTPALLRASARLGPRWHERACFALPMAPHLAAFTLAAVAIVPQYIRGETNLFNERVGIVCVAGALLVAARYAYALLRALRLMRGSPAPREAAVGVWAADMPIRIVDNAYPILMVTGLFAPKIVVSRRLLDHALVSPEALEVAFAHEFAHLRHFDNLKLFMLSSLAPPLRDSAVVRSWRRAAEIAADSDAVAGSRARAILLAETLLVTARAVPPQAHAPIKLGLLPHEEELENRIHRLLGQEPEGAERVGRLNLAAASAFILFVANLLVPLALVPIHSITEYLLHL